MFLTDITITESIIIDSIRELSSNSAASADGIPSSLFLNLLHPFLPCLNSLFYLVTLTHLSKKCYCPCFKSGDRTVPSNYRPISLTSVINKVLERIIRKQIVVFLFLKDS